MLSFDSWRHIECIISYLQASIVVLPVVTSIQSFFYQLTRPGGDYTVHNYVAVIEDFSPEAVLVETVS